ncbi:MAG: O-antigen ligase family protein, partial [Chloroflexota bacterium]
IDEIIIEPVATNLTPGVHTAEIVASRGWDQWALNGFSVGYTPPQNRLSGPLQLVGGMLLVLSLVMMTQVEWHKIRPPFGSWFEQLSNQRQLLFTGATAVIVALSGWLTWGEQASGIYRRLGETGQLTLTAAVASLFYVTPTLYIYVIALVILFGLIYFRPSWGLALVAVCFPLYVPPLAKPILNYRFSPTEVFMLVTFAAVLLRTYAGRLQGVKERQEPLISMPKLLRVDWLVLLFTAVATASLFVTDRLDVATNEYRVVIIEPVLFYITMRLVKPSKAELWLIFEAFLLGGILVAGYGFWQYASGSDELITAEGGLLRIRSFYGSPNNVGLYLGRILPLLTALILLGSSSLKKRKWSYSAIWLLTAVVTLLTFSRGAILLGLPAAMLFVFWQWQKQNGRKTWPWVAVGGITAVIGLILLLQVPQLAGRFDLRGQTSFFRLALWQASWQMFLDHPWLGVGLDNFLYAYRGEYILNAAWQEPDLNHPHNIFLDFATRLGLLGLISGGLLFISLGQSLKANLAKLDGKWWALTVGMIGTLIDILFHGLVDHSFFLVDLAFVFMWLLATAVTLQEKRPLGNHVK